MSYSIQNINGCTKKFLFSFDKIDLTKEIQAALVDKQKTVNLKGFRVGKAPLDMVKKFYGTQVESDAFYRFVSNQFYEAVKTEKIRAIGYPKFDKTEYEPGKKVSFEAVVEVFPEIELKDFKSYTFKKEKEEVNAEDVKKLENQYLAQKAQITEVTDPATKLANGFFAVFNFEGELKDGTKPDNMKASEYMLEIGSGQFIPGFEEGMIGMKKADKKTITVTFPADYHEASLQSQPVKFAVEVLEIKQKTFPELTDELCKELGFESQADFKAKSQEKLKVNKKREVQSKLQQEILEKIIQDNKFDIPSALLADQKNSVKQDVSKTLKQQGFNDEMMNMYFEKWDADITQKAEFQVRSGLILDKLAKAYKVEATESDLDKKIAEMAGASGMKVEEISHFYKNNENIKKNLMFAIREEKTFEKIISEMKVS